MNGGGEDGFGGNFYGFGGPVGGFGGVALVRRVLGVSIGMALGTDLRPRLYGKDR